MYRRAYIELNKVKLAILSERPLYEGFEFSNSDSNKVSRMLKKKARF